MAKYLLLKHYRGAPTPVNDVPMDRWTPQEVSDHLQFMNDFAARLQETGEFVDGQALAPEGLWVRYDGEGRPPVTDGPFAETKDLIAGWMVVDVEGSLLPQSVLIRRLTCNTGKLSARVLFDPQQGLPGKPPRATRRAGALVCEWGSLALTLQSFPDVEVLPGQEISVQVPAGSRLTLVMGIIDRSPAVLVGSDRAESLLDETKSRWERWSTDIDYDGPYRNAVIRSLITLQLLTFSPSGAPVAA
jgi:hypothetical protein